MQDLSIPLSSLWLSAHRLNFSAGDHSWKEISSPVVIGLSSLCEKELCAGEASSLPVCAKHLGWIPSVLVGCVHLAMLGLSQNLSLSKMQGETFQCVLNKAGKWKHITTDTFCHLVHLFRKGRSWRAGSGPYPTDTRLLEQSASQEVSCVSPVWFVLVKPFICWGKNKLYGAFVILQFCWPYTLLDFWIWDHANSDTLSSGVILFSVVNQ